MTGLAPRSWLRWLVLLVAGAVAHLGPSFASNWRLEIEEVELAVGDLSDIAVTVSPRADGTAEVRARVGALALPWPLRPLPRLDFHCARAQLTGGGAGLAFTCAAGTIGLGPPGEGPPGRATLELAPGRGDLRMENAPFLGGRVGARLRVRDGVLERLEVSLRDVSAARLLVPDAPVAVTAGRVDLTIAADPSNASPGLTLDLRGRDVAYQSADGLNAGESLAVAAELTGPLPGPGSDRGRGSALQGTIAVRDGVVAIGHQVIDFARSPLGAELGGAWDPVTRTLAIDRLQVEHRGVLRAEIGARLTLAPGPALEHLEVEIYPESLPAVFSSYVEGFLVGTPAGNVDLSGNLQVSAAYRDGRAEASARIGNVSVADRSGRFSVDGIDGVVRWASRPEGPGAALTRVAWKAARVLRVPLAAGEVAGTLTGRRFELARPARIGVFDGAVRVDSLVASALGTPALAWSVRGALEPMSLAVVARELDWPAFGGRLAGTVPVVEYAGGVLRVHGSLEADVFDGKVTVRDMVLERPLGVLPRLRAEVEARALSLELLTQAFSFGEILGRIDGTIRGLELVDWQPTAFDAEFGTRPGDDSKRRISQRAVDTLASVGGGPSALLSSTFLRFFDRFSYRRLGLRCRLRGGICEMSGVRDEDSGYVIVEGAGVPQITVKGYNRRVDWRTLVRRLRQARDAKGPVVK